MKRTTSYVAAGAITLALMGCGATADTTGNTEAPAETTACLDSETAADAGMAAADALDDAYQASKTADVDQMARSLHEGAEWMQIAAEASEADPAIAVPAGLAADLLDSAAEHIDGATTVAEVDASTADILEATEYVNEATAATKATTLEPC